jgi:hypothetical protein
MHGEQTNVSRMISVPDVGEWDGLQNVGFIAIQLPDMAASPRIQKFCYIFVI